MARRLRNLLRASVQTQGREPATLMKLLFVHNNFPAQFKHVAAWFGADPSHEVRAIATQTARNVPGVQLHQYTFSGVAHGATHPFARRFEIECQRAEQVLYLASNLASTGFIPDVIVVHNGWGEALPLRTVFPNARIIAYCEYFYLQKGSDVNFDPEFPLLGNDALVGLSAKNAMSLLSLIDADIAVSPTNWQKSTYPAEFQQKIRVAHEGVDTTALRPNEHAEFMLDSGRVLTRDDEIVTFVSRNLEPLRGYHIFMRALPRILAQRPEAHVLVAGGFGTSYGAPPPAGKSWHDVFLEEQAGRLDLSRVHFLGQIPYERYQALLQTSSVHVYLTYPFVLSWSCVEAMASGCVLIASATPTVQEVVNDENGVLVPFHDHETLAARVTEMLADRPRFAHLGANARRTAVERFDLKGACLPRLVEIICEQAQQKR
jgi:glycosyltransferase involved in cell wall biosynthesis